MGLKSLAERMRALEGEPPQPREPEALTYTRVKKKGWVVGYRWLRGGTDQAPTISLALLAHLIKTPEETHTTIAHCVDDVECFLASVGVPDVVMDLVNKEANVLFGFNVSLLEGAPDLISSAELTALSDEDARLLASRIDGWRFVVSSYQRRDQFGTLHIRLSEKTLPLYCGPKSEGWMWHAEEAIRDDETLWPIYCEHLTAICTAVEEDPIHASSRQRTEAYILTMQGR